MRALTRPAVLLAGLATVAASVLMPSAAFAAGNTVTTDELKSALSSVVTATAAAETEGFAGVTVWTDEDAVGTGSSHTRTSLVSARTGRAADYTRDSKGVLLDGYVQVTGYGVYTYLPPVEAEPVVKYMGRSGASWLVHKEATTDANPADGRPSVHVAQVLDEIISPDDDATVYHDATVTTDGETRVIEMPFTISEGGEPLTGSVTIKDVNGVMTQSQFDLSDMRLADTTYVYGDQQVDLPAAKAVVGRAAFNDAYALQQNAGRVKKLADATAKSLAKTVKSKKSTKVKVTALRRAAFNRAAAANADTWNSDVALYSVKNVTGGVRITERNPYTKKTVSYTLKLTGKKVTVRKS
jgi:hypothetical protein